MVYPKSLKKGDTIGVIAPSGGAKLKYIDKAIENLEKLGLYVTEGNNIRNMEYLVSDTAKNRADEFLKFFLDDNIKYIISARGGEFLIDILPFIHEKKELIEKCKNIKYFQGYSDNSLLNIYLTTNFSIPTVHANTLTDFCMKDFHKSIQNTVDFMFLDNNEKFIQRNFEKYQTEEFEDRTKGYNLVNSVSYKVLDGKQSLINITGRLIGGCLEAINQLLGTKFDNVSNYCKKQKEGIIWYIDIYEDNSPEIYRKLNQMKNALWFENVNAIIIGRTYGGKNIGDFSYEYSLSKALSDLNVPVIYDADIGHVAPQLTLINGSVANIKFEKGNFEITQEFI